MSAQFEHPDFPREIADAPDIENIPVAESMHALMGAVAEIHTGVRQIQEALDPAPAVDVMDVSGMTHADIEAISDKETADFLAPDATPAPIDPSKVKAGDTATVEVIPLHGPRYSLAGEVYRVDTSGPLWIGPVSITAPDEDIVRVTLTDHQPAPEPEPEYRSQFVAVTDANGGASYEGFIDADGDFYGMEDGFLRLASLENYQNARPLVVIDPAAVDVDALAKTVRKASDTSPHIWYMPEIVRAVLAELGIEAP